MTGTVTRNYTMPVGTVVEIDAEVKDEDQNPVDITGTTIIVRWKNDAADADGAAIATANGTVTDGPAGLYQFTVPPEATAAPGEFVYHVEIDSGGDIYYPQKGEWIPYER